MATFLTTTDTSAAIERVIRTAKQELTLISAYVYPRVIYLQRLKDAAARGVRITLIFGKRPLDEKVMALFQEVDNLSIFYMHELHAKCFVNEQEAIVTSLNLLNGSEEKNREMGVRLMHDADKEAYDDCVNEVKSILAFAMPIHAPRRHSGASKVVSGLTPFPAKGHCIRCGKEQPCNPDAPLYYDDFSVWVRYQDADFWEQHCHTCGAKASVSMAKPLCAKCNVTYKTALLELDAKNAKNEWKRTWRRRVARV